MNEKVSGCSNSRCAEIKSERDRLKRQYDILWLQYDRAMEKLEYGTKEEAVGK